MGGKEVPSETLEVPVLMAGQGAFVRSELMQAPAALPGSPSW